MKSAFIIADDLGYGERRDQGIFDSFSKGTCVINGGCLSFIYMLFVLAGVVCGASLLPNGKSSKQAAGSARRVLKRIKVPVICGANVSVVEAELPLSAVLGLHLNLTEGHSIHNPSLHFSSKRQVWSDYKPCSCSTSSTTSGEFVLGDASLVRTEINAQIAWFVRSVGRLPSFVNGHNHVHVHPLVWPALQRLVAWWNSGEALQNRLVRGRIVWVRMPVEKLDFGERAGESETEEKKYFWANQTFYQKVIQSSKRILSESAGSQHRTHDKDVQGMTSNTVDLSSPLQVDSPVQRDCADTVSDSATEDPQLLNESVGRDSPITGDTDSDCLVESGERTRDSVVGHPLVDCEPGGVRRGSEERHQCDLRSGLECGPIDSPRGHDRTPLLQYDEKTRMEQPKTKSHGGETEQTDAPQRHPQLLRHPRFVGLSLMGRLMSADRLGDALHGTPDQDNAPRPPLLLSAPISTQLSLQSDLGTLSVRRCSVQHFRAILGRAGSDKGQSSVENDTRPSAESSRDDDSRVSGGLSLDDDDKGVSVEKTDCIRRTGLFCGLICATEHSDKDRSPGQREGLRVVTDTRGGDALADGGIHGEERAHCVELMVHPGYCMKPDTSPLYRNDTFSQCKSREHELSVLCSEKVRGLFLGGGRE